MSPVTIRLDAQFGTPYPRSAGFDTDSARRALARAKVHWGRLDAEKLLTDAPPAGKEYRTPEMYYKTVLKGARDIADECPRDVIFE